MQVEILISRHWQDAGIERPLSVGEIVDLPEGVACALIATGAAKRPMVAPERAVVMAAPERKGKKRAAA